MTDLSYQHVAALDDPAKPHRRVYYCPATDMHVKVHARREGEFGLIKWRITGSLCGADGHALTAADGAPLVHSRPQLLHIASEDTPRYEDGAMMPAFTPEEAAQRMAADLDSAIRLMIVRVEAAELKRRALEQLPG